MAAAERCPNCGTPVADRFCPHCGQEAEDLRRPLQPIVTEWLGSAFAFDSRVVRTVRALAIHPGALAAEYVGGRRAGYVPPVRLYVFMGVMFFLAMAWADGGPLRFMAGSADLDPEEFHAAAVTTFSYVHFLLLPVSALFLMLVSWRRFYIEHFIFVAYYGAYALAILAIVLAVYALFDLRSHGPVWAERTLLLTAGAVGAGHFLVSLRRFYGGSWIANVARAMVFTFLYLMGLSLVAVGVVLLTLWMSF